MHALVIASSNPFLFSAGADIKAFTSMDKEAGEQLIHAVYYALRNGPAWNQTLLIVTYDEHGFYGHPDHIQANRVTLAAAEATGIPDKLYYTAVPRSMVAGFGDLLREQGIEPPEPIEQDQEFGTPDALVTTTVDCARFTDAKYDSLFAHASQAENIFFLNMGRELFSNVFGREMFVRVEDRTGAPVPEDDLFAGLR